MPDTQLNKAEGSITVGKGGAGPSPVQKFTTSGSWTKPVWLDRVEIEITGAGDSGDGLSGAGGFGKCISL